MIFKQSAAVHIAGFTFSGNKFKFAEHEVGILANLCGNSRLIVYLRYSHVTVHC